MQITRNGNITIETTNKCLGCLEVGGVCGRVESYPASEVARVLGCTVPQLEDIDADDDAEGYDGLRVRDVIEHNLRGRVVRRGQRIE